MGVAVFFHLLALIIFFGNCKRLLQSRISSQRIHGNTSHLRYYYLDLYVGTPPQKQSLLIDTGSYFTGFPCKQLCKNCGAHINEIFDLDCYNNKLLLLHLFYHVQVVHL